MGYLPIVEFNQPDRVIWLTFAPTPSGNLLRGPGHSVSSHCRRLIRHIQVSAITPAVRLGWLPGRDTLTPCDIFRRPVHDSWPTRMPLNAGRCFARAMECRAPRIPPYTHTHSPHSSSGGGAGPGWAGGGGVRSHLRPVAVARSVRHAPPSPALLSAGSLPHRRVTTPTAGSLRPINFLGQPRAPAAARLSHRPEAALVGLQWHRRRRRLSAYSAARLRQPRVPRTEPGPPCVQLT